MRLNPVYRVISMEADDTCLLYSHEIILQPIDESELADLKKGVVSADGYERRSQIRMNVSEEVFHSLRVGMLYQPAFATFVFAEEAA
jgi:hypothetical protein